MPDQVRVVFDQDALAFLLESPEGPVGRDLLRRGIQVERRVQQMIHMHGTGRVYVRRGRVHQASAPGEPPASDTGLYAATIGQQLERDAQGLIEKVGTNDKRGPWLELGTRRMAARPHLRPGLDAAR